MSQKRLRIAGRKYLIRPVRAREGLEVIVELSRLINTTAPYLSSLADKSPRVRSLALARAVQEAEGLPDALFAIASKASGVPEDVLDLASAAEFFTLMRTIIKINNWDAFWNTAYSLRILEEREALQWFMAGLNRLGIKR